MSEEKVLTLRGKKAVWAPGGGTGPIDLKRLPEGYPYKEQSEKVVFEGKDLPFEYDSGYANGYWGADERTPDSLIAVGEKYTVILDGVTYPDVVASDPEGMGRLVVMGKISEEYDYPFVIATSERDGYWIFTINVMSDAATHSVTILGAAEIVHTIDPEYLPEGYPYKERGIVLDVTHDFPSYRGQSFPCGEVALEAGKDYKVTIVAPDGNVASTVVTADEIETDGLGLAPHISVPNSSVAGLDVTYFSDENRFSVAIIGSGGQYTVTIATETIQPMAEEFMPLLTSPNGTKYKLTVSDDGTLSAVAVS